MKKILLIALLCFSCNLIAIAENIGDIQEVIETNMTKDVMWTNLKKWVSSSFNSYEHVVDLEDKDAGTIIVKWKNTFIPQASKSIEMEASSTIKVDIKEGKYRYEVSNSQIEVKTNIGRVSDMGASERQKAINDLQFIIDFSTKEYGESTKWAINEKFIGLVNQYKEKLDTTPQYKNEKKSKLSKEWEQANGEYEILSDASNGYNTISQAMISSLKKSIVEKDEW